MLKSDSPMREAASVISCTSRNMRRAVKNTIADPSSTLNNHNNRKRQRSFRRTCSSSRSETPRYMWLPSCKGTDTTRKGVGSPLQAANRTVYRLQPCFPGSHRARRLSVAHSDPQRQRPIRAALQKEHRVVRATSRALPVRHFPAGKLGHFSDHAVVQVILRGALRNIAQRLRHFARKPRVGTALNIVRHKVMQEDKDYHRSAGERQRAHNEMRHAALC